MYVVRPLSEYNKNPDALSQPPDGPNSGYMVILDKEAETYSFFGLFKNHSLKGFPFPQNKELTICYTQSNGQNSSSTSYDDTILIPVLNLPLSSNRYYAIKPLGKHKGEAFTCSREEDMVTCCFCTSIQDTKPKPFDPKNVYQQFEINVKEYFLAGKGYFYAKSVAPDGFPPYFLRRKGWRIRAETPKKYKLDEVAPGLNASLRARRPDIDFLPSYRTSEAVVVGKWYSPFMFVKESTLTLRDQVERSPFYQVTLEQRWEQIFSSRNHYHEGKSVNVDVNLDRETVYVAGNKVDWDDRNAVEGVIWFRSYGKAAGEETTMGLSVELVQRMKWEAERGGWKDGKGRQVKVERTEKFEGKGDWNEFGCYVLVESFIIRRLDGTVVLNWDFRHTQHIKSLWN
ncbi:OLC1v1032461C1 [Oldenlandia corymbosa var. corymbosa]|uniref:OLC1v1032461C1 n=1 Tax=Oldenlandia corymbosa var. corymbosa TaxID=529605 RepID=A0AAV1CP35_OLDCO|nr:OLC1v1032461C1 [Oldenlandia corymbosa var. corymbosa]